MAWRPYLLAVSCIVAVALSGAACDETPSAPSSPSPSPSPSPTPSPSPGPGTFALTGKITGSPLGEAVADAQVEAMHGGDPTVTASSDGAGGFSLTGLTAQQYVIRVTRNGYNARNQDVTLTGNMGLDIVMARNRVAVIGSVTEAGCTTAVPDARVDVVDGPDAGKSASSGSSGYGIDGVSWGTFRVRASKSGYAGPIEATLIVPPPLAINGATARQDFQLQSLVPRFTMLGTLRNRAVETGGQVNGALVEIISGPNAGRSTTSVNGSYQFHDLISGLAPLRVSHPDYVTYAEEGARV